MKVGARCSFKFPGKWFKILAMDILAHGLWTGVAYKAANNNRESKGRKPFNLKWAVFWGMFPDLFAFTIMFSWLIWGLAFGSLKFADFPGPQSVEPSPANSLSVFRLTQFLYSLSHSLVVFILIFGLVWLIRRGPVWELGAWLLRIFIDVPTHTYRFYPTPFLWPISEWKFDGFSWGTPWFMVVNYSAIIIVYFLLRRRKRNPDD